MRDDNETDSAGFLEHMGGTALTAVAFPVTSGADGDLNCLEAAARSTTGEVGEVRIGTRGFSLVRLTSVEPLTSQPAPLHLNAMKFPLRERPFSNVRLTPDECDEYETLLDAVVNATLEERERFVHNDNRTLSKKQWKAVKTRDDVTVYKRLGRDPCAPGQGPQFVQPAESYHWRLPKMIAVGSIPGSLDDIMYGIVTPDAPSIMVKTSYVQDELVDSAVLHKIRGATRDDPFRYVGLKWIAKTVALSPTAIVWPRDFVILESTGLHSFQDGSRMGFHAMHSIDHPLCHELDALGIQRGKFSTCYLYFQRNPGTVEVYMTTFVDPGGNAPDTIAISSAAATAIGMWKSAWCAQNKMLSYLLENDNARRRFRAQSNLTYPAPLANKRSCHLCSKAFRSFRTVKACQLCSGWVCSKCRIARKLSSANESLEVVQRVVEICKGCMAHVAVANAFEAAVDQYAPSIEGEAAGPEASQPKASIEDGERQREYSTESYATQTGSLTSLGDFSRVASWRDDDESSTRSRDPSESESVSMETIDDWEQHRKHSSASVPILGPSSMPTAVPIEELDDEEDLVDHHHQLYRQMQSLCLTAEQTHYITALNASRVLESSRIKQSS